MKINLATCPKKHTRDLDKAASPEETLAWAASRFRQAGLDILAENRRIDTGRLGIPVFLATCGADARAVMPTRKQMGKGSSPQQAEASGLMELVERFSFFSFWENPEGSVLASWDAARAMFRSDLIPIEQIIASVEDVISPENASRLLNSLEWHFYPATLLGEDRIVWLPLEWFRMLGEFNGSAAGNTLEEALLQALCELVERHVCAMASATRPPLPTLTVSQEKDPVLDGLLAAFEKNGVHLLLKDMSLSMPLPTVAALAWDPATFPASSEIVFTAGTATSPIKAAIRAITEVAQLGGDFSTGSVYEASGLPKFRSLREAAWLFEGPQRPLGSLPDIARPDILEELRILVEKLRPAPVYAIATTSPRLGIPAAWCIVPGLKFRERDKNACVGLFVGRRLYEEASLEEAVAGLELLREIYGPRHFLPFFRGMLALREGDAQTAAAHFTEAKRLAPEQEAAGLAAFYAGHALMLIPDWTAARPWLLQALELDPELKEAANLLGVGHYKAGEYGEAEKFFNLALSIDKGSTVDLANRGICKKFQGDAKGAREDLEAALALDPELEFAWKHLRELDGER